MTDTDRENLAYVVFDLHRLFRSDFERGVTEAGLGITPAEARALAALRRQGPIRQHHLAERLGIGNMSMSNLLDRLEAAGLIRREPAPQDRRAKTIHLTDAAGPMLDRMSEISLESRRRARGMIATADWDRFLELAQEVRANLMAVRAENASALPPGPDQ